MYEIRVYDNHRDIPWKGSHIHLTPGMPLPIDDAELADHIRKFSNPEQHRGISVKEVEAKTKNPSRMTLDELRGLADSVGAEYEDSDTRSELMKRIKVTNNA